MNFGIYYPPFNLDNDDGGTVAPRWMEWINGFDLMLKNCAVDRNDKLSMLLRFSGRGVRDIFAGLNVDTDGNEEEAFIAAKRALGDHFRRLSLANVTYQSYMFSWMRQEDFEGFEAFVGRLRKAADACQFKGDSDRRIRDQIVKGCRSDDVRRQAFLGDLSLDDLIRVGKDLQESDDTDAGLLTSFGNILSVFAPESASHLLSIWPEEPLGKSSAHSIATPHSHPAGKKETVTKREASTTTATTHVPAPLPARSNGTQRESSAQPTPSASSEQSRLSVEEQKKERAKEKRRRQRRETYEAAKVKPFEELTDKQKKLLQYQERFRQKLTARLQDRKRGVGVVPNEDGWKVEDEIGGDD